MVAVARDRVFQVDTVVINFRETDFVVVNFVVFGGECFLWVRSQDGCLRGAIPMRSGQKSGVAER